MRVYVLNKKGKPLMPTTPRKARILLKEKKAIVVGREPFTIQLNYATGENKQNITLGIDAGYQTVGFSAITENQELISGEVELLKGISERLKERKMYRTQRRNRLRYREPRFNNRKRTKKWLAPSINHKFDAHIKIVNFIKSMLPISKTIVEAANFDIQKIKNPEINGKGYQEGKQKDFWNLREYILHRDNHKCQNPDCKNKSKQKIFETHHIGFWKKDRSNRPSNLITLCTKCHTLKNHKKLGFLYGWQPKLKSFKPETFMSTIRWRIVNTLRCEYTYGYLTKSKRIECKIEKTHFNDAFCIAKGNQQERITPISLQQKRKNNRSLEKFYDAKIIDIRTGEKVAGSELHCGRRTRNKNCNGENLRKYRGYKVSKGRRQIRKQRYSIRPQDIVLFGGEIYRALGVQNKGTYLKMTDGVKSIVKNIKQVQVVFHQKTMLVGADSISARKMGRYGICPY